MARAALATSIDPGARLRGPLHRLLQDHFDRFRGIYEDVYEHAAGRSRKVVDDVVVRFPDCGVLEAGFARLRCPECRSEYSLAFSC